VSASGAPAASSNWHARPVGTVEDPQLRKDLCQLAAERPRYRMLHQQLRRKGWTINHKLVYRLYREEGLIVRRRIRKRIAAARRQQLDAPTKPDQRWSMG